MNDDREWFTRATGGGSAPASEHAIHRDDADAIAITPSLRKGDSEANIVSGATEERILE